MVPIVIGAIVLLTGAGTTVVASDAAKPGDALYGIDRAVENVRLSFAGEDGRNELRIRFAEERLEEVEELIDNASRTRKSDEADDTVATSSDDEADDDTDLDETEARNVEAGLQNALDILTELKAARPENPGLETAIDQLLDRLNNRIMTLPSNIDVRVDSDDLEEDGIDGSRRSEIKLEVRGDGETRIETRSDGERVRIELDDEGKIEVRIQEDRRGSNSDEEDRLDSDLREETRLRLDDDRIEFESNSGSDSSEDDNIEDILKGLEDAQKELEDIEERARKAAEKEEEENSDRDDSGDRSESRSDDSDSDRDDDSSNSGSSDSGDDSDNSGSGSNY